MMTISVFYQILLFIRYPILLGGFKLGYKVLDMSEPGDIFYGHGADEDFILDEVHEH